MTTLIGAAKVMPRWRHSSTSYFGLSRLYETNSSDEVSEKSLIGKTALEDALQADVFALLVRDVLLQELLVRLLLDVDEVRNVDDLGDLRVVLPNAEIVLDHRSHLDPLR